MTDSLQLRGLRGATTSSENTVQAIRDAVNELVEALMDQNNLSPQQLVSVTFSVTADLDASFPAATARHRPGWDAVACWMFNKWPCRETWPAASACSPMPGCRRRNPCTTLTCAER